MPEIAAADPVEALRADLQVMKREIDGLQVQVMEARRPWYHDVATFISIAALLFSFGTTYASCQRTRQQDIHAARTELRRFIQRLNAMPRELMQAQQEFKEQPIVFQQLSGLMNSENALVAKQAAEVIARIPDRVSSTEYLAVAGALGNSGLLDRAGELLRQAVQSSSDVNDEAGALRMYGSYLMSTGQLAEGRQHFERALRVFDRYPTQHGYYVASTTTLTYVFWAQAEIGVSQCTAAAARIADAERNAAALMPGPMTDNIRGQITETRKALDACSAMAAGLAGQANGSAAPRPVVPSALDAVSPR